MKIIDLFFPRQVKCMFCGRETSKYGICDDCYNRLPFIKSPTCDICGGRVLGQGKVCYECKNRHMNFNRCYCVLEYVDDVRNKIGSLKQGGLRYIGETFAYLVEEKFNELAEDIDVILPVPISDNRLSARGFNQSEVLCEMLKETGKVNMEILIRIKDNPHQTGLSREFREENLKESFVVTNRKLIKGKTILLVDDIYTTGSTLNACSKELLKCKPKRIVALCLARTPINLGKVVD